MKKQIERIISEDINLVVSRHGSNNLYPWIIDCLMELGIEQKKKVFTYVIRATRTYYLKELIALMTGIDKDVLNNYLNLRDVFDIYSKETLKKEDRNKYLDATDKLIDSDLYFSNPREEIAEFDDVIDYILLDDKPDEKIERSDIFIIDNFYRLYNDSKYSVVEIVDRFKKYAKKYDAKFILFSAYNDFTDIGNLENTQVVEI